jgi:ATP-binding cassette, subfamily C (CFTR/MRP), member 1
VSSLGLAFKISSSLLGLSIAYTLTLTSALNFALRRISELEGRMNSVEVICLFVLYFFVSAKYGFFWMLQRLSDYATNLPSELDKGETKVSKSWIKKGDIKFENVSFKYRDDGPFILKHVNLHIQPGEKVGVVGRTGKIPSFQVFSPAHFSFSIILVFL